MQNVDWLLVRLSLAFLHRPLLFCTLYAFFPQTYAAGKLLKKSVQRLKHVRLPLPYTFSLTALHALCCILNNPDTTFALSLPLLMIGSTSFFCFNLYRDKKSG